MDAGAPALAGPIAYCIVSRVAKILEQGASLVRNASVAATDLIRDAIIDGRLAPGERLKEVELATELGISRTPVREALLVLQTEGLVEAVPNRGATVRAHTAEDLDDLYQLRALLEGYAARRAATRITEEDVARLARELRALRRACRRTTTCATLVKRERLLPQHDHRDRRQRPARLMVRKVIELPLVYKSYIWYSPDQKHISAHYHRQIVNALMAGDAERAELIMKEHVVRGPRSPRRACPRPRGTGAAVSE